MEWKQEYNKPALFIGGGLVALLLLKKLNIFGKVGETFTSIVDGSFVDGETDREENDRIKKQFEVDVRQGLKPSLSDKELSDLAEKLHAALKGIGNDLQSVADVFNKMVNVQDVRILVAKFGIRSKENLNEWLKSDLVGYKLYVNLGSEKMWVTNFVTVADMVRAILRKKNINFAI